MDSHRNIRLRPILLLVFCSARYFAIKDFFSEIKDLEVLCPYTSFCSQNASSSNQILDGHRPCCLSCSCQPDCGFYGNCCFSNIDILYTNENPIVTCRSALASELSREIPGGKHYRMVHLCAITNASCESTSLGKDHLFHPVTSRDTRMTYINEFCARCNGAMDTVPWRKAVIYAPDTASMLTGFLEDALGEGRLSNSSDWEVYFVPPDDFDIPQDYSCKPHMVRACERSNKYSQFCELFNATFAVHTTVSDVQYANIFCFLCFKWGLESNGSSVKKMCDYSDDLPTLKVVSDFQLTILLDKNIPNSNTYPLSVTDESSNRCQNNNVFVTSFVSGCRHVKCPWGQIRLNNKCGFYSKMWIGGPFSMMLRLAAKGNNAKIPKEMFTSMSISERNDKHARWLKRKALKNWRVLVFQHPYINKPYVEYLLIKVTYPTHRVNPEHLKTMIEAALKDTWIINYMNKTFELEAKFNDYDKYDFLWPISKQYLTFDIDEKNGLSYIPRRAHCLEKYTGYEHEVIHPVSIIEGEMVANLLGAGTTITELLLCDQVDLLPEEFDYECDAVYFKPRNITIYAVSVVGQVSDIQTGPDGTNSSLAHKRKKQIVRVCLRHLGESMNDNSNLTVSYVLLFIGISLASSIKISN